MAIADDGPRQIARIFAAPEFDAMVAEIDRIKAENPKA